jgi:hypothetical protein
MQITYRVRNSFFDRPAVVGRLTIARRKALTKAGAYVRKRARSSMRRRKSASKPGSPPSAHESGSAPSLKTILFAYDEQIDGVVVGPVKLNRYINGVEARSTVGALHEFGETANISEHRYMPDGSGWMPQTTVMEWRRTDRRRSLRIRPGLRLEQRKRVAQYPKRPFMAPALAAEQSKFPDLFRDSIKAK